MVKLGLPRLVWFFLHMAMFMGSIALPIVTTHELRGTKADVGLIFSVCAFLEVLVMFTFVIRPSKAGSRHWISFGFLAFMLYFLVATWTSSVAVLLGAQVLRAVGIGLIGYQGISYIQELMPNQVGIVAALFFNTINAGFLLSGLTAGAWAGLWLSIPVHRLCGAERVGIIAASFSAHGPLYLRGVGLVCARGYAKESAVAIRTFADQALIIDGITCCPATYA